jgi:uncharacterized protein YceK
MIRIFLVLIMVTQLSGCAIFWQTAAGTVVGNLGAELIKDELEEEEDSKP